MLSVCSTSVPPENVRKPLKTFSGGMEIKHWLKWVKLPFNESFKPVVELRQDVLKVYGCFSRLDDC